MWDWASFDEGVTIENGPNSSCRGQGTFFSVPCCLDELVAHFQRGRYRGIPLENGPIAHAEGRGHFLTSPGEKAYQSVEKSCFVFWNDNLLA